MIMGISDRVFAMQQGQKIVLGTPQEVQKNKDVIKAYLGEEEIS
jgi:branched-chain amino acid transport system ATP-binding protein